MRLHSKRHPLHRLNRNRFPPLSKHHHRRRLAATNYTITPALARGPYGKNASLPNVLANPLKSKYDWAGDGINGGDAGLQILVRGGVPADGLIPMGELATTRIDMSFGTFRAGMKVTGTRGTCGAFFWVDTRILLISLY